LNRLQASPNQYNLSKIEQEKVSTGIDAYWIINMDLNPNYKSTRPVPKSLTIKIHPKTREIMVVEYMY
jgi:hypothetical protein